ncbi:hypothetical protein BCh11DRAFT_02811 [Burkholderia sp. Ch1-1]|nr:hypothetical protein BCh11DRAFT_02811 [Burkholderia sp. Ch1-1]
MEQLNMEHNVLLLCVNYQNDAETLAFVKSIFAIDQRRRVSVVIADNTVGSEADRARFQGDVMTLGERVCVVSENRNLGYFGGLNAALKKSQTQFRGTPFSCVILSNTDIEFGDRHFFDDLCSLVSRHSGEACMQNESLVGLIAPTIESSRTKANQNPLYRKKPSRGKFTYLSAVYSVYPFGVVHRLLSKVKNVLKAKLVRKPAAEKDEFVYAAHGSFMVLLNRYFARGGQLRYLEFLFCEEIFVAEQCAAMGLKTLFSPALRVAHREHATTGLFPSRAIVRYLQRSHLFCRNSYF